MFKKNLFFLQFCYNKTPNNMDTCHAPSCLPVWPVGVGVCSIRGTAIIKPPSCSILTILIVPALMNIPYSIYYVFILAEVLHYSNIKLYIKYQFHTKRIAVF